MESKTQSPTPNKIPDPVGQHNMSNASQTPLGLEVGPTPEKEASCAVTAGLCPVDATNYREYSQRVAWAGYSHPGRPSGGLSS